MSAQFNVSEVGFFSPEDWPTTICAWRGCCIEVFARAEHSIADCLRTLKSAGVTIGKDAYNPFAGNRLKALRTCIVQHGFGGHGKAALKKITEWERVYEARAHLAHGEVKATESGISISHITFDGKSETRHQPKHLTRSEMLELLMEIEAAQKALHHQLGQIKALAGKASAQTASPKKPDPGSNPG